MISIHCPRIGIKPCKPEEFAEKINRMTEFPETERTPEQERIERTILSCMVALGGSADCTFVPGRGLRMSSQVGTLFLDKDGEKVSITEGESGGIRALEQFRGAE